MNSVFLKNNIRETSKLELNLDIFLSSQTIEVIKSNSRLYSVKNLDFEIDKINKELICDSNFANKKKDTFKDYFIDSVSPLKQTMIKNKIIKEKLEKIISFLSKVFQETKLVENDFLLEEEEIKLVYFILKKKFFNRTHCYINTDLSKNNLKNLVNIIYNLDPYKRVEEMNKFIFKFTLKNLKQKFFSIHNLPFTKESEDIFYNYYFKEDVVKEKNFEYLIQFLRQKKKFNNTFFYHIFLNDYFKNDFFQYLDNFLIDDHTKIIQRKFKKLFQILKRNMKNNEIKKAFNLFLVTFSTKKRIKFPWNSSEVKNAVIHFKKLINSFEQKIIY